MNRPHRPKSLVAVLDIVGVLLLAGYVVSQGPAYRTIRRFDNLDDWRTACNKLDSIYGPVWSAAQRWNPLLDTATKWGDFSYQPPPRIPATQP